MLPYQAKLECLPLTFNPLTSKNIDCLTAHTAWLVCFISTVNGCSNKKRKEKAYPWKTGASSGHITNLKQAILETSDIYDLIVRDPFPD